MTKVQGSHVNTPYARTRELNPKIVYFCNFCNFCGFGGDEGGFEMTTDTATTIVTDVRWSYLSARLSVEVGFQGHYLMISARNREARQ